MIKPGQRVMHVDDDPQLTRIVAERLKQRGYDVVSINDPDQAIPELARSDCRVVILDIDMPRKNGLELLQEIKHYDAGIQVVILTGIVALTTMLRSIRFGAEACCFKPLEDVNELIEPLEDCFRKINRWWSALEELSQRRKHTAPVTTE